jgi:L-ascorbate metabolism protein UlaG (beta-lactamase superfamily)
MKRIIHLLLLITGPLLMSCTSAPGHQGNPSGHFDGKHFVNTDSMDKSAGDMVRFGWGALTSSADWPNWIDIEQQTVANERVYEGISVTFVNHATFLIQVDGINILTDPVYSERVSPFQWAGPKRVHAPGIAMEDLPPIDVILISHNHYDHLDEATLRSLLESQENPPLLLAGLGNRELLIELGSSDQRDLDWEESAHHEGIEFVFTECRHRSGRGISDQMKTLWGSFVIKTSQGNLYFAGDTGYSPHLQAAGDRHGPFALSLLPIGAYEPRWFMKDVHLNPEEAVRAHRELRSEYSIGIHFGTFQ